jgi:hypothetical protein
LSAERQAAVKFGAVHDEGKRFARVVRDRNAGRRVQGHRPDSPDDDPLGQVKALECLRSEDARAIDRFPNDRMFLHQGDVEPSPRQTFARGTPGRAGADDHDIMGRSHTEIIRLH